MAGSGWAKGQLEAMSPERTADICSEGTRLDAGLARDAFICFLVQVVGSLGRPEAGPGGGVTTPSRGWGVGLGPCGSPVALTSAMPSGDQRELCRVPWRETCWEGAFQAKMPSGQDASCPLALLVDKATRPPAGGRGYCLGS